MSGGTKIALAIVGVGAVGFLVYKATAAPATVPRNTAPSNTGTPFLSGIIPAITSILPFVHNNAPANAPLMNIGVPSADTSAYGTDPNYNPAQGDYGPYLPSSSLPAS